MPKSPLEDTLNLSPLEREIILLRAVLDMIGDMVNYETMTLHFNDPDSSVMFNTMTHMAFFSVILVDFLAKPNEFFRGDKAYIDHLKDICLTPRLGPAADIKELGEAVHTFANWLCARVTIERRWFPSLELEIDLTIERRVFIGICGNIAKHNFTQLTRQANRLKQIFSENGKSIPLDKCIFALQDFRQQFYDDVLHYHASTIAESLNNIRWGVYAYVSPVRTRYVTNYYDQDLRINAYTYTHPNEVTSEVGKTCFGDLMNEAMRPPYFQRFSTTRYLKTRY